MEGRLGHDLGPRGAGLPAHRVRRLRPHRRADLRFQRPVPAIPVTGLPAPHLVVQRRLPHPDHRALRRPGRILHRREPGHLPRRRSCQGIDAGTPALPGSRDPIRSTGGWFDVWYDWTPALHSHVGYSIDDPFDQDVTTGRIYNAFFFGNLIYDLTAKFLVGMEVSSWKTHLGRHQPRPCRLGPLRLRRKVQLLNGATRLRCDPSGRHTGRSGSLSCRPSLCVLERTGWRSRPHREVRRASTGQRKEGPRQIIAKPTRSFHLSGSLR